MAKGKRRNKKRAEVKDEPKGGDKKGPIIIVLIVGVVAVMAWATLGLRKPSVDVGSDIQLPSYAYVTARSEQSYRVAIDPLVRSGDTLSKIPCYCGCVGTGHTSLKDCFLDSHGSMCDICQYEALEVYEMLKKGVPMADIRNTIDARYGGGRYGPGTNTPPVV